MAGKDPTGGFDAAFFRTQIRQTMQMGLANATNATVLFRWTTTHTYAHGDPINLPYSWAATPVTNTAHIDVAVPCAVQFQERGVEGTGEGVFDASKAVLTLLDEDYIKVYGSDTVLIGDNEYNIDLVGPPQGLFQVDVYTLYVTAKSIGELPVNSVVVLS